MITKPVKGKSGFGEHLNGMSKKVKKKSGYMDEFNMRDELIG